MQRAHDRAAAAVAPAQWHAPPAAVRAARARVCAAATAAASLIRTWWERERLRRELSAMSPRDFGDVAVPPGAIKNEVGRWPWQKIHLGAAWRENRRE